MVMIDPNAAFFLESGNAALDLLNTAAASDDAPPEQLRSPNDLVAWLEATGLVPPDRSDPTVLRILLTEAHRLRDDVALLIEAMRDREPPPSHVLFGINRVLDAARTSVELVVDANGSRLLTRERGQALLATLAPVARAAADLVVDVDPSRIRRCASDACERRFLDTSKGGRRKWCSMATCGNRAKAESHRRRHAVG